MELDELVAQSGEAVSPEYMINWIERYARFESPPPLYLRAPQAVPEGWKLVPIKPTEEMCIAAREQRDYDIRRGAEFTLDSNIYHAMIAAAPSPACSNVASDLEGE